MELKMHIWSEILFIALCVLIVLLTATTFV